VPYRAIFALVLFGITAFLLYRTGHIRLAATFGATAYSFSSKATKTVSRWLLRANVRSVARGLGLAIIQKAEGSKIVLKPHSLQKRIGLANAV